MHQNKDYNILLNKLISGTITDEEKWTLERASLDDPFLADALEGFYDNDVANKTTLTLSKPTKIRSISRYKPLMVAASMILLLGFSFLMIQNMDNDTSDVMAEAKQDEILMEEEIAISGSDSDDETYTDMNQNETAAEVTDKSPSPIVAAPRTPKVTKRESEPSLKAKNKSPKRISSPALEEQVEKVSSDSESSKESEFDDMDIMAEDAIVSNGQSARIKMIIDGVPVLKPQLIKGHVYDQSGLPISRAIVSTETSTDRAITNDQGYFSMVVTDMDQQINVASKGFSPQTTAVKPELSFKLKKAQSSFGQEPMLLVETMDEKELELEYSRLIDAELRGPFSLCPQENNISKRIKIRVEISEEGQLLNLDYVTDLSENCQLIIEDKIMNMSLQNKFQGKKAVSFYYNLRL